MLRILKPQVLVGLGMLLLTSCVHGASEYLYPVASIYKETHHELFLVYQKDLHLELWLWDPQTCHASKGLLSTFIPAGIQVLPDGSGFSFIDDGIMRIKYFVKRSPKSLYFDLPIYGIGLVHWIDSEEFYLSAKAYHHYSIFHGTVEGDLVEIAGAPNVDSLYPQKMDGLLFYIERDEELNHRIVSQPYPTITQEGEGGLKATTEQTEHVLDVGPAKIAFLHMKDPHTGYFIKHPSDVDRHDATITFEYCRFTRGHEKWQLETLFDFVIPTALLLSAQESLYESILPLLPRHEEAKIYYATCSDERGYETVMCVFDEELKTTRKVTFKGSQNQSFFGPCLAGKTVFFGGSMASSSLDHRTTQAPAMWLDDEGSLCFDMPSLSTHA